MLRRPEPCNRPRPGDYLALAFTMIAGYLAFQWGLSLPEEALIISYLAMAFYRLGKNIIPTKNLVI